MMMGKLKIKHNIKLVLLILLSILILIFLIATLIFNVWDERNFFINNKTITNITNDNGEIESQKINAKSICYEANIKYPVIDSKIINTAVLDSVEGMFFDFVHNIKKLNFRCDNKLIIDYENNSFVENYSSIKLIKKVKLTHTESRATLAWTLDKNTGQILTLSDILENIGAINENLLPDSNFFIDNENRVIEVFSRNDGLFISIDKYSLHLKRDSFDGIFKDMFIPNYSNNVDCISEKCVVLTYDDGPSIYTEQLLDVLRAKNVRASFFVIGNRVHQYHETVARTAFEGHDVGSHSWSHAKIWGRSGFELERDINDTINTIQVTTNKKVSFFRPPWGEINDVLNHELEKAGLMTVLWSIDTNDWQTRNAESTCSTVINRVKPGGIVLMHDIYASTIEATICIIDRLSNDYKFVNLTDLYF